MVLHNNGESFKMLTYYYPKIKGSWVMNKFNKIERYVLDNISTLAFVSKNSMIRFEKNHPNFFKTKITYVYNGLPQKDVVKNKLSKKLNFCCVASITDRKGQEMIIDALGQLTPDERNDFHFTFVGDGYLRKKLEQKCNKLGIQDLVSFVGNQTEVDLYLSRSDIFILPSKDEGLPMSIIEAQRAKLPIISTYVAGIPEMVEHERSGLLFNPNLDELIVILKNINNYDWDKMGERSFEIYKEKFNINQMIMNYADLLNKLMK